MDQPNHTVELDFSVLQFYDYYVVSRLREDVVFDRPQVKELVEVCNHYFEDRHFVYISQRVHNYNVNPTIYLKLEEARHLCGIAIVSQKTSALNMAAFEKNFAKVPFEVFLDLKEAQKWAKQMLKERR
ncbi:hypothetical protein SAMN04488034_10210 [Salinimicrobium catena]|uniref:STAS/SEC14 domain-containing protein n=1 Tax=Salinimicrobium catena TaxID=390640 RepID=A0A1H5KUF2_9FLAO|nr:hypothetical protein [Salinimicrobium catena]SDL01933.1 hypothetical protein SAMN04488140_10210 [Salinimicrobium catena]SEE68452.1 hypothetical protein SAMN04488034_10210 [Salinimicrobium catena]